ncbi:MAG: SpoIIE family protein phosphatase [Bacteroidota bacterium]
MLLLLNAQVYAQPHSPYIQNFTNKVYGKNSNPEIYAVIQDNQNRIIAGTSKGVKIYNGVSWEFVGVNAGSYVTALSKTATGKIMVGAVGDFGTLQANNYGSYVFVSLASGLNINEAVWRVHCIAETAYFQTDSCIYVVETGKVIAEIRPETSFHLSFLVGSRILVRQRDKGICEIKNNELVLIDSTQQVRKEGVFAIFEKDGQLNYFTRNELSNIAYEKSIYGGIQLHDGNYLLNTLNNGVYLLDKKFRVINHINAQQGLADNDVKNCYQGSDGNIWLATNNGLSFIEYASGISYYNNLQGIEGDVQDVWNYGPRLYAATSKGVFIQRGKDFEPTAIRAAAWQFTGSDKELFCATAEGIYQLSENDQSKRILAGNFNNVERINDRFFISGLTGVLVTDAQFHIIQKIELPLSTTLQIYHDSERNEVWIGTAVSGLIRIRPNLSYELYNARDGLNTAWVKPMSGSAGIPVFATLEGLQRFIYEEEIRAQLPDSLKNNPDFTRGTFEPVGGNTAISELFSFKGATMAIVANEVMELKDSNFIKSVYNHLDFGRINKVKIIAGSCYLCTSDGLVVLEKNAPKPETSFILSLASVSAGGSKLAFNSANEIKYADNNLVFVFQAPVYLHGTAVYFRYKVEGLDDNWSDAIPDNHISLNNLREGAYTMLIRAENSFGEQSETLSFPFYINPPWYRTLWAYGIYLIALVGLFWVSIYMSRRRLQRKNEELEQIVTERTSEIAQQKHLIEEKHTEITDSINYAERIQSALMMNDEHWQAISKEHFVLFKPRDVVSGDFYWAYQNEQVAVWAAADCTGHGVPGAFMSMLGIGFLNEIVIEGNVYQPAAILNSLRSKIIKALDQKGAADERKDGMDISLCCLDKKTGKLWFAGANNPLLFITKNTEKALAMNDAKMLSVNDYHLVTVSGDKMPVGKYVNDETPFSQQEISIEKGDLLYSITDGFPDQFGGAAGKKFMIKRFKQLLIENAHLPMNEQHTLLNNTFINWIAEGNAEQIDDVCVVGVKL